MNGLFGLICADGPQDLMLMATDVLTEYQKIQNQQNDNVYKIFLLSKRLDSLDKQLKDDLLDKQAMIESIMRFLVVKKVVYENNYASYVPYVSDDDRSDDSDSENDDN